MKKLKDKKFMQKIILVILIVLLFNFVMPVYSNAETIGGILLQPAIQFINSIADAALAMLQFFLYNEDFIVSYGAFFQNPTEIFLIPRAQLDLQGTFEKYGMNVDADDKTNIQIDANSFATFDLFQLITPGGIIQSIVSSITTGNPMTYTIPAIKYTPEAIFGNKVPALDINFINPKDWGNDTMNKKSIAMALHNEIAKWYVALRNLAIVILLSVLLYVGIRMVISSTSSDKAKYKQMLFDWFIALAILFFLHYIMSFILTMTSVITEGIYDSAAQIVVEVTDLPGQGVGDTTGDTYKFRTSLTGLIRFQTQYENSGSAIIFTIMYVAMVIYTWLFTWTYLKRAITVAALTLLAPLIAITYPIDKISDGKAQAFGVWFREFIFNALLQPFHLIIYTVFLGAATEIAANNPIYAILVLAFMTQAEKLLRKMFGFEKSSTAGTLGAAAGMFGGAAAFKMLNSAVSSVAKAGSKDKSGGGSNKDSKVRVKAKNDATKGLNAFAQSGQNGGGNSSQQGRSASARQGNRNTNSETDPERRAALQRYANEGYDQNANGEHFNPYTDDYDPNYNPLNDTAYYNPQLPQATIDRTGRMDGRGVSATRTTSNVQQPNTPVVPANYTRQIPGEGAGGRGRTSIRTMANRTRQLLAPTEAGIEARREFMSDPKNRARLAVARKVLGGTAKVAGRVALGAAGGAIGLAAGIASDDLDDVLKYGAAGVGLGAMGLPAVGKGVVSSAQNMAGDLRYTYNKEVYGPTQAAIMEQTREYKHNDKNADFAREYFRESNGGREPTREELDQTLNEAADYYNEGIDEDKVFKAMKLSASERSEIEKSMSEEQRRANREEIERQAKARAITIAKLAQDPTITRDVLTNPSKSSDLLNSWQREFEQKHHMRSEDAKEQADYVMGLVRQFKGIY